MRFLLFISLLFTCSLQGKAESTDIFVNTSFFSTTVDVYGRAFSGIMVFNKEEADNKYRILFTTTAGPKLLDMYISPDSYEKIYCIKQLDRKLILKFFQKDFAVVTLLHRNKGNLAVQNGTEEINIRKKDTVKYYYNSDKQLVKAEYISKKKKLFEVDYTYNTGNLETISVRHYNFKMTFILTRLEQ